MMQTKFFFKKIEDDQKKFLEDYIEEKVEKIEKHLSRIPEGSKMLEVKYEKFATHDACKIDLVLHTPKQKFMASEDAHNTKEAVDLAIDKLKAQLRKAFSS